MQQGFNHCPGASVAHLRPMVHGSVGKEFSADFLPAPVAGIIGAMVFWQWIYATTLYGVSFFVAKRQTRISRLETFTFIIVVNSFWVLCALLGLYVSVRLIMDGNYSVLGS